MNKKLKVTTSSIAIRPNAEPNNEQYYFDLIKGHYSTSELKFDIVETNPEYIILNIYLGEFYETGFQQYVFDSTYPITISKKLEGRSASYTFELIYDL